LADGGLDLYERAKIRTRELMTEHVPLPVDADVAAAMRAFVEQCDEEAS